MKTIRKLQLQNRAASTWDLFRDPARRGWLLSPNEHRPLTIRRRSVRWRRLTFSRQALRLTQLLFLVSQEENPRCQSRTEAAGLLFWPGMLVQVATKRRSGEQLAQIRLAAEPTSRHGLPDASRTGGRHGGKRNGELPPGRSTPAEAPPHAGVNSAPRFRFPSPSLRLD